MPVEIRISELPETLAPVGTDILPLVVVGTGTTSKATFNVLAASAAWSSQYQPLAAVLTGTTASYTTALNTKLNGIEAGADVTDAANVVAAGAYVAGGTDVTVLDGGTGSSTAAGARTNLGLVIGTDVQAFSAVLAATTASFLIADETKLDGIAAGATANSTDAVLLARANHTGTQANTTITGLGTMSTQNAATVAITGGSVTGITDLTVADGGTGASDAATARTNLGLVIGTNVQAQDAELQAIAGLISVADRLPYFTGSGTAALATFTATARTLLDDASTTAMRTTLGLGTIATQNAATVAITGGSVTGITDITVLDGGTGSSTAAGARTNLGLVIGTDVQAYSAVLAATTASFLSADRTKLDGIAAGATANSTDAVLLARANHTGTQDVATITGLGTAATTAATAYATAAQGEKADTAVQPATLSGYAPMVAGAGIRFRGYGATDPATGNVTGDVFFKQA